MSKINNILTNFTGGMSKNNTSIFEEISYPDHMIVSILPGKIMIDMILIFQNRMA